MNHKPAAGIIREPVPAAIIAPDRTGTPGTRCNRYQAPAALISMAPPPDAGRINAAIHRDPEPHRRTAPDTRTPAPVRNRNRPAAGAPREPGTGTLLQFTRTAYQYATTDYNLFKKFSCIMPSIRYNHYVIILKIGEN